MAKTIRTATTTRPASITQNDDLTLTVSGLLVNNRTLGSAVKVEVQSPLNGAAIFTIPANKTFTGTAIVVLDKSASTSSLAISAATGGVQASVGSTVGGTTVVDVTIAGGAGGNAVTAVTTGSPTGSVTLLGYYK